MNPVLARLIEQREQQETFIDELLGRVAAEERDLVDAERRNIEAARERLTELDAQIEPLEQFEATRAQHRSAAGTVRPPANAGNDSGRAPLGVQPREQKYRSAGHFLVDYMRALPSVDGRPGDVDAGQRIAAAMGRAAGDVAPGVHQTTADTPGLLPEPIIGEILNDLDGARPLIASLGAKDLAAIPGKVFHRPHVTQHTLSDEQAAEKAELASRELRIEGIPFTKRTHGGWLNVSRQDIDWTSPAAWQAIVDDLQLAYGVDTEDDTAVNFAAAVTQSVSIPEADENTIEAWVGALYEAAVMAATANGTKRASSLRLSDTIWTSVDMWAQLGKVLTVHAVTQRSNQEAGAASPTGFAGSILDIPRVMVPGLPAGTVIVGRKALYEYYEQRLGLLQAIVPRVLGVEIAYGGYVADGPIDATGFAKIEIDDTP